MTRRERGDVHLLLPGYLATVYPLEHQSYYVLRLPMSTKRPHEVRPESNITFSQEKKKVLCSSASDAFNVSSSSNSGLLGINRRSTVANNRQKVCDPQGCQVHSSEKLGNMRRLGFMEYYLKNGFDHFERTAMTKPHGLKNYVALEKLQLAPDSSECNAQTSPPPPTPAHHTV